MAFADLPFPDYPRSALRKILAEGSKAPPQHLDEIVDIACHAAGSARRSMLEVLDRSSDPRIAITAIGMANSLVRADAERLEEALREGAAAAGLATFSGKVEA